MFSTLIYYVDTLRRILIFVFKKESKKLVLNHRKKGTLSDTCLVHRNGKRKTDVLFVKKLIV